MAILVTGGAGFIGFHVCKALLERGEEVINVDNFNAAYSPKIKEDRHTILQQYPRYQLYRIDIAEYDQLKKVFQENAITKICHLAARAGVLPSLADPFPYERTNVLGTLNLFQLAKEFTVPDVVLASSSSVYGASQKFPSSEDDVVHHPISLYAATKKSGELVAHCYHHLFGLKVTVLRFFNVYGPWGRPDMMTWMFTENILKGKKINVNNSGDTWKDYTFISDIVRGVIAAIDHPFDFEIINLGNNTPVHLKRCIDIIEQETGKKAIVEMRPMQPGDVQKSYADISKAKRLLGWEPTTKMEQGLVEFIRWYQQYTEVPES